MPMSKIGFIAMFYVIGISFFGLGLVDVFRNVQFSLGSQEGMMTSSDPSVARVAKLPDADRAYGTTANVVYTTPQGQIAVPNKRIGGKMTERLARGEGIPVRFLGSDPHAALFDGAKMQMNWVALIGGAVALAVAIFAHRLLRRESGVG
jgi:hypothetical protein